MAITACCVFLLSESGPWKKDILEKQMASDILLVANSLFL